MCCQFLFFYTDLQCLFIAKFIGEPGSKGFSIPLSRNSDFWFLISSNCWYKWQSKWKFRSCVVNSDKKIHESNDFWKCIRTIHSSYPRSRGGVGSYELIMGSYWIIVILTRKVTNLWIQPWLLFKNDRLHQVGVIQKCIITETSVCVSGHKFVNSTPLVREQWK